jgi:hypothetical protein
VQVSISGWTSSVQVFAHPILRNHTGNQNLQLSAQDHQDRPELGLTIVHINEIAADTAWHGAPNPDISPPHDLSTFP